MEQQLSAKGTTLYVSRVNSGADSAKNPRPTVILTHNMWGNHKITLRHVRMFNEMGFDCVTFDLYKATSIKETLTFQIKSLHRFLYQEIVDQIADVQDSIPGPKIMFSLSGPSLCSLIASSERQDVVANICDGGPFKEIYTCTLRMFRLQMPVPTLPLQMLTTALGYFYWGLNSFPHLQNALSGWPKSRPILSLRGGKDPIVFPENIEHAFERYPELPLTVALIPDGVHLDGLKNFPEIYKKAVADFLREQGLYIP